jgi:Insertion element 4 transposase N-terminal/Transposase DDE domain
MVITTSDSKEALMDDRTAGTAAAHSESFDPVPYLRGLTQLIDEQRLDFILSRTSRRQRRKRRLLASSVVWLVICMSLFATLSIPKVWRHLHPFSDTPEPDESAFTKARQRLGVAAMRELFREVAGPMATPGTPGAFYRGWRLMGIDGTTFDMPDTPENERVFGRGGNQRSPNAFPQVRVLALCELGTHAICDIALRPICGSEQAMVPHLLRSLHAGMLLLWDRGFFGFNLIESVLGRGCHLLARVKTSQLIFKRLETLSDGSYLTKIYPSYPDRLHDRNGRIVRIIEYTHDDPNRPGHGNMNRLLTDLLDPADLPAREAVVLYHQRWEEELTFDEIKTHLNSRELLLRSKTPRGVVQELYGLFLAHRIIRQVMTDAAETENLDPDRLSFTNSLRILQDHLHEAPDHPVPVWYERLLREIKQQQLRPRRNRWYPRVVKRKMKKWDKKRPHHRHPPQPSKSFADSVLIT